MESTLLAFYWFSLFTWCLGYLHLGSSIYRSIVSLFFFLLCYDNLMSLHYQVILTKSSKLGSFPSFSVLWNNLHNVWNSLQVLYNLVLKYSRPSIFFSGWREQGGDETNFPIFKFLLGLFNYSGFPFFHKSIFLTFLENYLFHLVLKKQLYGNNIHIPYNSRISCVAFSGFWIFRVVKPSPQSIIEHFHHSKKKSIPTSSHFHFPSTSPTASPRQLLTYYKNM